MTLTQTHHVHDAIGVGNIMMLFRMEVGAKVPDCA